VNGEAIYGSTKSPLPWQPAWGRVTQKGDNLYLHVFDWPADGKIVVTDLMNPVGKAYLLKSNWLGWHKGLRTVSVALTATNEPSITIFVPRNAPDKISSTIVLKLKGAPKVYLPPALTD